MADGDRILDPLIDVIKGEGDDWKDLKNVDMTTISWDMLRQKYRTNDPERYLTRMTDEEADWMFRNDKFDVENSTTATHITRYLEWQYARWEARGGGYSFDSWLKVTDAKLPTYFPEGWAHQDDAGNQIINPDLAEPETEEFDAFGNEIGGTAFPSGMEAEGITFDSEGNLIQVDPDTGFVRILKAADEDGGEGMPYVTMGNEIWQEQADGTWEVVGTKELGIEGFQDFVGPEGFNWTIDPNTGQLVQSGYDPTQDFNRQMQEQQFGLQERQFASQEGFQERQTDVMEAQQEQSEAQAILAQEQWNRMHPEIAEGWLADLFETEEGTPITQSSNLSSNVSAANFGNLTDEQKKVMGWLQGTGRVKKSYKPGWLQAQSYQPARR